MAASVCTGMRNPQKRGLLTTLCGNENGKLEIITPDRDMIISATSIRVMRQRIWLFALRATFFQTRAAQPVAPALDQWLVADLYCWTSSSPFVAGPKNPLIHHARRNAISTATTAAPSPALPLKVATIASFWRSCLPSARQHIDDATWQHFASLLPALDLDTGARTAGITVESSQDRSNGWRWRICCNKPAMCRGTGGAAPATGRSFWLTGGKLPDANGANRQRAQSVWWCIRLRKADCFNAVSLSAILLALLTRELVLTVETAYWITLLLDIPVAPDGHHPLWRAKLRLDAGHYRQRVQPDVLVILRTLASRSQTSAAATRHLLGGLTPRSRSMNQRYPASSGLLLHRMPVCFARGKIWMKPSGS